MLSASWERAAKPGDRQPTGAPNPPSGRHLSSSSELGVCLTIKATTFYSVCTEPKQTTVYRLLFSFLFEMRRFGVFPLPYGLSTNPSPQQWLQQTGRRSRRRHSRACTAPLRPVKEWGRGQELVSTVTRGAVWARSGPAVHVALFNTVN